MPKIYKCPICGSKEYFLIHGVNRDSRNANNEENSLIEYSLGVGERDQYTFKINAEVCLCKKCGHIDLFNGELVKKIVNIEESKFNEKLKIEKEIQIINDLIAPYQDELTDLDRRLELLKNKIKDDSITVKELKEYKIEIVSIEDRQKQINKIIRQNLLKKEPLEREVVKLNEQIQNKLK